MAKEFKLLGYSDTHPFSQVQITGRESVQELLKTLLDPLIPHFSPLSSRIKIPGATAVRFDVTASEIEGYARPLWGLASLLAGGGEYEGTEKWIEGLKAGTDPESVEFWGLSVDSDQRMVEMCCLGYTLAMVPEFWNKLNDLEKKNTENYLGGINDKVMPNTNWLWFRVFANLGLRANGSSKASNEKLMADIKHLESFYRGGGWSNDGPSHIHQMDYYSGSFAIQVLQLLYSVLYADTDPENAAEFRKRGTLFAADFIHYFDDEGRAIPFGRSVGYRFAMIAFWSAAVYADIELPEGVSWGVVKGIVLRNLRWWQTQPDIFGAAGTLTLGYSYPQMYLCENYNSPGSPYWSCIAFIMLAAPATHPFWTSPELPYPLITLPKIHLLPQPKHIVTHHGSHHLLLSSGQACGYAMKGTHAKYGKFAYSSAFAYSVPTGGYTLEQYALDSTLGLSDDDAETWKTRRTCETAGIEFLGEDKEPVLRSVWKPYKDVSIESFLVPSKEETPNWHIRAHRVETGRELLLAEGSFAISNVRKGDKRALGVFEKDKHEGTFPRILGNYDLSAEGSRSSRSEGTFAVSRGAAGIVDLLATAGKEGVDGKLEEEYAMIVNADPNTNLVESKTVIPTLVGKLRAGETKWYVSGVFGRPEGVDVKPETFLDGWEERPRIQGWLEELIKG